MMADPLNDEGIREFADVLTKNRVATVLPPPAPFAAGHGAALVRRLRRQTEAVRLLPHGAGRPLQVQSDLPGGRVERSSFFSCATSPRAQSSPPFAGFFAAIACLLSRMRSRVDGTCRLRHEGGGEPAGCQGAPFGPGGRSLPT